jgi:hypothetical protein
MCRKNKQIVQLICVLVHGRLLVVLARAFKTSAVFVIIRTFDEPMEYPQGADFNLFGACKPTLQWDPKPKHKVPILNSGFSKALTRQSWRIFYAPAACGVAQISPSSCTGCTARIPVKCSICIRHENPGATTTLPGSILRRAGKSRCSPTSRDIS